MMARWLSMACAAAVIGALLVGCSTGPPAQRALNQSRSIVSSGIEAGISWPDDAESIEVRARYNPCRCSAPEFEIRTYGRWKRVLLRGEPEMIEQLESEAVSLHGTRGLDFLRLQGRFDGSERYEPNGLQYERFEVLDYGVESGLGSSDSGGE